MRRLVAVGAALVALCFAGSSAAAPTAPTGEAGACNMVNTGAMHGMGIAVTNADPNGVDGMIVAIENTTPYGPPDFCPKPVDARMTRRTAHRRPGGLVDRELDAASKDIEHARRPGTAPSGRPAVSAPLDTTDEADLDSLRSARGGRVCRH